MCNCGPIATLDNISPSDVLIWRESIWKAKVLTSSCRAPKLFTIKLRAIDLSREKGLGASFSPLSGVFGVVISPQVQSGYRREQR